MAKTHWLNKFDKRRPVKRATTKFSGKFRQGTEEEHAELRRQIDAYVFGPASSTRRRGKG